MVAVALLTVLVGELVAVIVAVTGFGVEVGVFVLILVGISVLVGVLVKIGVAVASPPVAVVILEEVLAAYSSVSGMSKPSCAVLGCSSPKDIEITIQSHICPINRQNAFE